MSYSAVRCPHTVRGCTLHAAQLHSLSVPSRSLWVLSSSMTSLRTRHMAGVGTWRTMRTTSAGAPTRCRSSSRNTAISSWSPSGCFTNKSAGIKHLYIEPALVDRETYEWFVREHRSLPHCTSVYTSHPLPLPARTRWTMKTYYRNRRARRPFLMSVNAEIPVFSVHQLMIPSKPLSSTPRDVVALIRRCGGELAQRHSPLRLEEDITIP